MATGDRPEPSLKPFAAEFLGGALDEDQASLLGRLRDDNFFPDTVTHDAIRVLCDLPVGASSWLGEESTRREEARLRDEVERFAADFFTMAPAERRTRWRSLTDSCKAHAGPADRLRHLGTGLDLDRERIRDVAPLVERLVDGACSLFVLAPGPRAIARRDLVSELRGDQAVKASELARALRRVRRRHRSVAALAPEFLARLGPLTRPKRLRHVLRWAAGRFERTLNTPVEPAAFLATFALIIAMMIVFGALSPSRWPEPSPSEDHPPTPFRPPTVPWIAPGRSSSAESLRAFKDQFKGPIRSELQKLNKTIPEWDLERVVDALPTEELPETDMAILRLRGYWTDVVRKRYARELRAELATVGITLSEEEFQTLVRVCFPADESALPIGVPRSPRVGSP